MDLGNITSDAKAVIQKANTYTAGNNVTLGDTAYDDDKNATTTINVNGDGLVVMNNTGLISGGTLYSEVRPTTGGHYVNTAQTTATNLGALDTALYNLTNM